MIACITPSGHCLEESALTLQYASSAMRIKNRPIIQIDAKDQETASLAQQNKKLQEEVNKLRGLLRKKAEAQNQPLENLQVNSKDGHDENVCANVALPPTEDANEWREKYAALQSEHKSVLRKLENLELMFLKNEGFESQEQRETVYASKVISPAS